MLKRTLLPQQWEWPVTEGMVQNIWKMFCWRRLCPNTAPYRKKPGVASVKFRVTMDRIVPRHCATASFTWPNLNKQNLFWYHGREGGFNYISTPIKMKTTERGQAPGPPLSLHGARHANGDVSRSEVTPYVQRQLYWKDDDYDDSNWNGIFSTDLSYFVNLWVRYETLWFWPDFLP